jgi:hypothetical protein
MPVDLVSSAAAIEALESCEHSDFNAAIRNSRLSLRDHIRENIDSLNLSELTASLRILSRADRNAGLYQLVEELVSRIRELSNAQGWGSPVVAIRATSDVLQALVPFRDISGDLVEAAIKVLTDEQNQDGGWPVTAGGSNSTAVPSAMAITALAGAQPNQDGNDFRDASRYLQALLSRGWESLVSESGAVQVPAQVLRAAAVLKTFPFEIMSQGVQLILDQRNGDNAWGERKGGNSNVEATSGCVTAMCSAGANRLINSKFALSAINEAGAALQEARRELDLIRADVRNQVTRGTGRIVAENDRLNAKVLELEKEKKILVGKVEDGERKVQELLEEASNDLDVSKGRDSVKRYLGLVTYIRLLLGAFDSLKALPLMLMLLTSAIALVGVIMQVFLLTAKGEWLGVALLLVWSAALGPLSLELVRRWGRQYNDRRDVEAKLGVIGASDAKLVQRRLRILIKEWSAGTRELFFHMLSRTSEYTPESREAYVRSLARQLPLGESQRKDLTIILSLFSGLSDTEQKEVIYALREVPGRVAVS